MGYVFHILETNGKSETPLEIAGINLRGSIEDEPAIISKYIVFVENIEILDEKTQKYIRDELKTQLLAKFDFDTSRISVITLKDSQLQIIINKHCGSITKNFSDGDLLEILKKILVKTTKTTPSILMNSSNILLAEHERYQVK